MSMTLKQFRDLPEQSVTTTMKQQIIELVKSEPATQKHIAELLHRKEQFVNRQLKQMVDAGTLIRKKLSTGNERAKYYYGVAPRGSADKGTNEPAAATK